jgi:hypothetical protein
MLPGDIKSHKEKVEHIQQTLHSHLVERKIVDPVDPYSDKLFRKEAIEWIVSTNQVITSAYPPFQPL